MPKVFDRVLLTLCCLAALGVISGGFLNRAPNRLASSLPLALWQAPKLEVLIAMISFAVLIALSFMRRERLRSHATLAAATVMLWASLAGAGGLATRLANTDPPQARYSLGLAFWSLIALAFFAMLDAFQRAKFTLVTRAGFCAALCAGFVLMATSGLFDNLSLAREFASHRDILLSELLRHLLLVGVAMGLALLVSMPLAAVVLRFSFPRSFVFSGLGIVQTIPSIALFGLLIAPLSALAARFAILRDLGINGTGIAPAIIALMLYSLLPLVRGFYIGFTEVPVEVKDAAFGIGFDAKSTFLKVELPLALPALLSGLRVVTIQAIGLAAVAALIGAGGLGTFVFQGIGQYALDLVLVGAIPIILLALAADLTFQILLGLARREL
ncbi:MAG TPA: ABC transporter permease [Beijerinckia sp.]|nr:ABC transporter permease [Beijerinckia sp.]